MSTNETANFYLPVRSSWIASLTYWAPADPASAKVEDGGFLLITRKDRTGTLYAGISPEIASELAGVGKVDHSVGKAYHRLFRSGSLESAELTYNSQQLNTQQVAEALAAYKQVVTA